MVEPVKVTTYVTGGEPRFIRENLLKTVEQAYNIELDIVGWCGKTDNPSGEIPAVELILHIKSMASHAHRLYAKKWSDRHECLMIETDVKFSHSKEQYDRILLPYLKSKQSEDETPTNLVKGEEPMVSFDPKAIALENELVTTNKVWQVLPYVKGNDGKALTSEDRVKVWATNVETHTSFKADDLHNMLAMWKHIGSMQGRTSNAYLIGRKDVFKEAKKQWLTDYVVSLMPKNMREVDLVHREVFGNVLPKNFVEFLEKEWFNPPVAVVEEPVAVEPVQPIQPVVVAKPEPAAIVQPVQPVVVAKPEPIAIVEPIAVVQPVALPKVIITEPKPVVLSYPQDHEVLFDGESFKVNPKFGCVTLARVEAKVVLVGAKVELTFDESREQGVLLNVQLKGI